MQTNGKNFIVKVDIYNADVLVHVGSRLGLKRLLCKYYDKKTVEGLVSGIKKNTLGQTTATPRGATLIYLRDANDINTLSHEVFHAVCLIMRRIGVVLSEETEECYAYLTGYLTERIREAVVN